MRRRTWRVHARRELRELWLGIRWERESKQRGELLSVFVCLLPGHPIVVTTLAYDTTENCP